MLGKGAERSRNKATIAHTIPMQKMGRPQDVANAALFLASEESQYITGTELSIDGGILAGASAAPAKQQ